MSKKYVSGTGEWATHTVNIQRGCRSDCRYCFAKANSVRFGRSTPENWSTPTINDESFNKIFPKKNGTIMFPSTHDISPDNINQCISILRSMLSAENEVLIVSKPHLSCVIKMCRELAEYKKQILFRFTIGSSADDILTYWEPNAPKFAERLSSLQYAFNEGFQTSVSCEPMLDGGISSVVDQVKPYVTDAIWLGKPNKLMTRVKMNGGDDTALMNAEGCMTIFTDQFIFDLYNQYRDDPKIKWKDSIKQVVGLERSTVKGLDS